MLDYSKIVILITGCISPSSNIYMLAIKDSNERRRQYIDSIYYYIEKSKVRKIVYCDNSNAKPDEKLFEDAKKHGKELEWISFQGDEEKTISKGKGYGEAEIVKYAMEHSVLLRNSEYFIKITGRLKVRNLNFFVRTAKISNIYFCPVRTLTNQLYINTRIYMMPISVYKKYFWNSGDYVFDAEDIYLEHAFGKCIISGNVNYKKFPYLPRIDGISGSTGRNYSSNIRLYIKECLKLWLYDTRRSYQSWSENQV